MFAFFSSGRMLVFSLMIFFLGACATKPYAMTSSVPVTSEKQTLIYVASHGWHTGFILPAEAVYRQLPGLSSRFLDSPYLEFGWGDKGFYQTNEITTAITLRAIFLPTESVVHVVAVPHDAKQFFSNSKILPLTLSHPSLNQLVAFIKDSFKQDNEGNPVPMKAGLYGNSQFYKGVGYYHLFNTCNKWTAKGLQSAGLNISPTFKLTAGSVMTAVKQERYQIN